MTRCERVYEIFIRLCHQPNISLMEAWQKTFNTTEVFDVYFYLERLHYEIELLEIELNDLGVPSKIFEPILKRATALTKNYNFLNQINSFKLKPEELSQFYGFSFQGKDEEIKELDISEDLQIMLKSLELVKDEELKLILADIVSSFHRVQMLPNIQGKQGLEESFKELYCKINANFDEVSKAPKEYKQSLYKTYTYIDQILKFADKWLSRGNNLSKLLENL